MLTPVWMIPPNNFPIFQLAQVTPMRGVRPLLPPKLSISRQYWASAVVWVCNWAENMNRQTIHENSAWIKGSNSSVVYLTQFVWTKYAHIRVCVKSSLDGWWWVLGDWFVQPASSNFSLSWLREYLDMFGYFHHCLGEVSIATGSAFCNARTMGTWSSLSSLILNESSKKCPLFYGKSAICRWLRGQIAYAKHVYGSLLLGLHPQTSISNLLSSDTNESRAIQRKRAAREARTQHYSKPSTNCWNVHEFLGLYNVIYIYIPYLRYNCWLWLFWLGLMPLCCLHHH